MEKYYLLKDSNKYYWEYWKNNNKFTIQYGTLGTKGTTKELKSGLFLNAENIINKEEIKIKSKGYKHLDEIQQFRLLIEYTIDFNGNEKDLVRLCQVADR